MGGTESSPKGSVFVTTEHPEYVSGDVVNGMAHLQLNEPVFVKGEYRMTWWLFGSFWLGKRGRRFGWQRPPLLRF